MEKEKAATVRREVELVMLGDGAVGKTAITNRFREAEFCARHLPTIECDCVTVCQSVAGQTLTTKIWDLGTTASSHLNIQKVLKHAQGIMVVFNVSYRLSYDNLSVWTDFIKEFRNPRAVVYLVGNQIDLSESRKVTRQEASVFAHDHGMRYLETSAKLNLNAKGILDDMLRAIHDPVHYRECLPIPQSPVPRPKKRRCTLL